MTKTEFQLLAISDPRLVAHATSAQPVWLWSIDGRHVLWANAVGADVFGAGNSAALVRKNLGPADAHRRQIAQLSGRLPRGGAARLERLKGFGARLGVLMTCSCARLEFADGRTGVLIQALETSLRGMALNERLRRLVEGQELPVAAFARDGSLAGASEAARPLLGFHDLHEGNLAAARSEALSDGYAEIAIEAGVMSLQRVGSGAEIGLIGLISPPVVVSPDESDTILPEGVPQPVARLAVPAYEQPALSNEAPAEFALIDEFSESLDAEPAPVTAPPLTGPPRQPVDGAATAVEELMASPGAATIPIEEPSRDMHTLFPRRVPLRFIWQMDTDGRFSLGSDEFTHLIGERTAAGFGRPWSEITEIFGLDPEDRVRAAVATRETWSGITLYWPVDGGGRLPVELSALPIHDERHVFAGYRGFGVCRDLDSLEYLAELRRLDLSDENLVDEAGEPDDPKTHSHMPRPRMPRPLAADIVPAGWEQAVGAHPPAEPDGMRSDPPGPAASIADENNPPTDLDEPLETPPNVVPFRPIGDTKPFALTPVENHAFNELARQLSERLDRDHLAAGEPVMTAEVTLPPAEAQPAGEPPREQVAAASPEWLAPPEPPARGELRRDRTLLDLLPTGVLIYRLDRLLYANPAFLQRIGYDCLHTLEQAGGLDALYVEAGVSSASSTSEAGMPVTISASEEAPATEGKLFTISWDGDSALALMFTPTPGAPSTEAIAAPAPEPPSIFIERPPPTVGHADAEDLAAILDTTAEGILMFDAEGNIHACNKSAEALFGYDGEDILRRNLIELFAPESQRAVIEYLEGVKGTGVASLLDHGRDVLGRVAKGGIIPLSMTMGRTRPDGLNFFAVFRDLSQSRKGENELQQARRLSDRAASAKADMLARISHEVRTPLNAILGFAEVMIAERFGTLGNERYVEYLKDIRASGERVIAIINDLSELSRIETGKLDLAFANQNLNEMVESCVAVMQPQANRERIIIRTSLAQALPPVVADGRALRQITMNLIGNSIRLANPAGQVIVSTALSDFGEVVLRVRDTGPGLNDNEVAAALEPFRTPPPSDQAADSSGVSLSLTKALVEANRAQFNLKTAAHSGTLVEVVFSRAMARS